MKQRYAPVKLRIRRKKRLPFVFIAALNCRRVMNAPMRRHRLSGPDRARFRRRLITHREHECMNGAPGRENSLQSLLRRPSVGRSVLFEELQREWIDAPGRMTPRAEGFEFGFPEEFRIDSAMMLRAELPVHRNRTFNISCFIKISLKRSKRRICELRKQRLARGRNKRVVCCPFRVAIDRNGIEGVESLPCDPLRIGRPVLVGARIAAFGIAVDRGPRFRRRHLLHGARPIPSVDSTCTPR